MSKNRATKPVMTGYCYDCKEYTEGTYHSMVGDQYAYVVDHPGCPGKPPPESTRPRRYQHSTK
ncbi:hypothetical protein LN042_11190 [Kitasatospora sp. RB6PN24]|uniref:hypothetical protein n=1 Tax=Kitasatospora humi TaxID=2893891 RepID=UPI001E34B871|nr:hypothetical protein [Kitasatospora humi]MCC9307659.1 hypothetical protein [Kitasatospora humi]